LTGDWEEADVATIRDVAEAAQVSTATVSRVLNGKNNVDPGLAERVRAAVAVLDYRPNVLAKALRTRATTVVGVIVPDIENPFHTAVVRGVEDAAQAGGHSLLLCNSDEDLAKETQYLEVLLSQGVAGLILEPVSEQQTRIAPFLERGVPVVAVDRSVSSARIDSVTVNNALGAQQATEVLIEEGYERIAMVAGLPGRFTSVGRLEGYKAALAEHGRQVETQLVVRGDYRFEGGYKAVQRLMARDPRPDAIFVANNTMALGALSALSDLELRVPQDVGFAAFDELPWRTGRQQPHAYVSQPGRAMGKLAADILLGRINGDTGPVRQVVLDPVLQRDTATPWLADGMRPTSSR
jgi:LacI family transcriptional regulator